MAIALQVIGKKKSGKTTTMCRFIQYAVHHELKVTAFKHTHHTVSMDVAGTDTDKFAQMGASQVGMQNDRGFFLHEQRSLQQNVSLESEIQQFTDPKTDLILIEGFKQADYPKLLLLGPTDQIEQFDLNNIIAVGSIYPEVVQRKSVVDLSREVAAIQWFEQWIQQATSEQKQIKEQGMDCLTHFNHQQRAKMVDVSEKKRTQRQATSSCRIKMTKETLQRIKEGVIEKGDVLAVAQVAAILAAKKTSELIPMCHMIPLSAVDVCFEDDQQSMLMITVTVKARQATGVEMEALTACQIAALTIYDMCKAMDRTMTITDCCLVEKKGGKSGHYRKV